MDAKTRWLNAYAIASFNPRARDGRESDSYQQGQSGWVSIHAPVMDAKPNDLFQLYL